MSLYQQDEAACEAISVGEGCRSFGLRAFVAEQIHSATVVPFEVGRRKDISVGKQVMGCNGLATSQRVLPLSSRMLIARFFFLIGTKGA